MMCRRLVYLIAMAMACQAHLCPIRLPQDEPPESPCKEKRTGKLVASREIYGVRKATPEMPFNRLDMEPAQYLLFLATNPFLAMHAKLYSGQVKVANATTSAYLSSPTHNDQQAMTMEDFAIIEKFYRKAMSSPLNTMRDYMKAPSNKESFQSNFTAWISDKFFAEQRLAGINPMTIQQITLSNKKGMHFESLKQLLNPQFNLAKAVGKVLGVLKEQSQASLMKAIKRGHLFVLYHPLANDLESSHDLTNNDKNRQMWQFKSPIAIFVSRKDNSELTPIAIQMDAKRDAPVYTPQDGENWMLAKLNTHLTDMSVSQIIEHLNKVHFVIEAVCLSVERQLSVQHPLHDVMRFHCRGIFTTNMLGGPELLHDQKTLDKVFEFGNEGANNLTKKAGEIIDWLDLDLKRNLKRRGVTGTKRLPYYPYRDDGLVIYEVLENMVKDYVNSFYKSNTSVIQDNELQKFSNEISKDGTGEIRGFPAHIRTKASLVKTFAQIIWLMTGQHTAINYALYDYGMYIPNISAKLYDVVGVPTNKFTTDRLQNRIGAAAQLFFFSSLSTFRMDRLFDYGSQLKTSQGKDIVSRYKLKLENEIEPVLVERNKDRLKQNHLTYPYLQPSWLTNGVQA